MVLLRIGITRAGFLSPSKTGRRNMIKVECVSCKSPYDVDERRIPEKGMKMRCPKCSTSFHGRA